jgi:hypothetical protein
VNPNSVAVIDLLKTFFADAVRYPRWPKPLHLIQGSLLVSGGVEIGNAARAVGTSTAHLLEIVTAPDPVEAVFRVRDQDLTSDSINRLKRKIGELVLARVAEIAFEDICNSEINSREFSMTDVRHGRTNTDFRLLNGGGRPLYRFNVKFFGSIFRRGAEMVGLAPSDCFPLATYKILAALQEQDREHLPYVFAIVGVPGLNAAAVAEIIPEADVRPVSMMSESRAVRRKRDFEDWLVDRIVGARSPAFATAYGRIRNAEWYVLSARRANMLMHGLLFERVYALAVPGFTRKFGGAEVDMHFSLSKDLVTLREFLAVLREDGQGKVTTMLERGTY